MIWGRFVCPSVCLSALWPLCASNHHVYGTAMYLAFITLFIAFLGGKVSHFFFPKQTKPPLLHFSTSLLSILTTYISSSFSSPGIYQVVTVINLLMGLIGAALTDLNCPRQSTFRTSTFAFLVRTSFHTFILLFIHCSVHLFLHPFLPSHSIAFILSPTPSIPSPLPDRWALVWSQRSTGP